MNWINESISDDCTEKNKINLIIGLFWKIATDILDIFNFFLPLLFYVMDDFLCDRPSNHSELPLLVWWEWGRPLSLTHTVTESSECFLLPESLPNLAINQILVFSMAPVSSNPLWHQYAENCCCWGKRGCWKQREWNSKCAVKTKTKRLKRS